MWLPFSPMADSAASMRSYPNDCAGSERERNGALYQWVRIVPWSIPFLIVILSEAKDLHFAANSRSFASLRMTMSNERRIQTGDQPRCFAQFSCCCFGPLRYLSPRLLGFRGPI